MKWEDWETLSPCRSNGTRKCPQSPGLLLGNSPQRLPTCPGEGETGELSCLEAPFPEPLLPGAPSLSPSNTSVGGRRCSPAPAGGAWPGRPVTTPQGPDDPRTPHTGPHPKPRGSESHFLSLGPFSLFGRNPRVMGSQGVATQRPEPTVFPLAMGPRGGEAGQGRARMRQGPDSSAERTVLGTFSSGAMDCVSPKRRSWDVCWVSCWGFLPCGGGSVVQMSLGRGALLPE